MKAIQLQDLYSTTSNKQLKAIQVNRVDPNPTKYNILNLKPDPIKISETKCLQSADHVYKHLQQKRWTKRLQSATRRFKVEAKSELGGAEQAKSKLGGAEQEKSELGEGKSAKERLSQMEQRSPVAGGEGNRRSPVEKEIGEQMADLEENQRRRKACSIQKWLEVDGPSLYHAEDAQTQNCKNGLCGWQNYAVFVQKVNNTTGSFPSLLLRQSKYRIPHLFDLDPVELLFLSLVIAGDDPQSAFGLHMQYVSAGRASNSSASDDEHEDHRLLPNNGN
ncbi:hypothetical protein LXL04_008108 [Taraxacum kok-saghyz]